MADFRHKIVIAGLRPNFDFFYLEGALFLFGFLLLFGLLVFVTPIVHYFANRRGCAGRNFHQIKTKTSGGRQGFFYRHNTQLVAFGVNHSDFARAYVAIDINTIRPVWLKCPSWLSYASTSQQN